MKAILSDIHGNLEALDAVLADIDRQGVTEIYCLGDIVGYGPNPLECIDRVMARCQVCLLGHFDTFVLVDPELLNDMAERVSRWARQQLAGGDARNAERLTFLAERPRIHREGPYQFVHGSPRNPLCEYVYPEDIHNALKMDRIFSLIEHTCFHANTHIPGVLTESRRFFRPDELNSRYDLIAGSEKTLVSVGSVGQPRDGDPRASYVLLDERRTAVTFAQTDGGSSRPDSPGEGAAPGGPRGDRPPDNFGSLTFCRVPYDQERTIARMHAIPEITTFHGDRLRDGR